MVVRNLALLGKEIERPVPVPGRRSGSCNVENGCLKLRADAHSSPSEVQALDVVIAQNLVFTGGWFHVLAFLRCRRRSGISSSMGPCCGDCSI
jgi:hypothetical protein